FMYGLDALQWSDEGGHDRLIFDGAKDWLYEMALWFGFVGEGVVCGLGEWVKWEVKCSELWVERGFLKGVSI
uniref:hypothetical protein n=1 Tax=Bacillus sp. WP8 TaxID=756828 RepID=UPI00164304BF